MARYFFHLRDGSDQLLDPEGVELPDLSAVEKRALVAARDMLSDEMKAGTLDLRYRIEVEDAEGNLLHSLPLEEAFTIIPSESNFTRKAAATLSCSYRPT